MRAIRDRAVGAAVEVCCQIVMAMVVVIGLGLMAWVWRAI